jgi:hypothetical protein
MKKMWLKLCCAVLCLTVITPLAYAGTINYYNITLQGTVLGRPFARPGLLVLTTPIIGATGTTNGANPLDVAIVSGKPATSPEIGAIQLSTNTLLLGGSAALDMAYVSFANNCVLINPDPKLSATGSIPMTITKS